MYGTGTDPSREIRPSSGGPVIASRPRILVISPDDAGPPDQGFRIRVHHLVRGLAAGDFDVTLLAASSSSDEGPIGPRIETITIDVGDADRRRSRRVRALDALTGRPTGSLFVRATALRPTVTSLLRDRRFDAVQVELPSLVRSVRRAGVPVVYDAHNIWAELAARRARLRRSPVRRAVGQLAARRLMTREVAAWQHATVCLATSPRDAEAIATRTGTPVEIVPNGVDLETVRSDDQRTAAANHDAEVVFVGLLSYGPNADAARELIESIAPIVRQSVPDLRLTIVGDGAPPSLLRLSSPSVTFTGRVPDVRPYLRSASAVAVPLRSGSGTRLKILEALAMGRPVVTTSVGAEGLGLLDETHALIADDPEALARGLVRVIGDPALATRLGQSGRALVEMEYDWEAIGRHLVSVYRRLLERPAA